MSAVGIDIGTNTIKAVWLDEAHDQYVFKSSIMASTPANGMMSEASLDQEEVAQTIRKMLMDAKIPLHDANLALPDSQVFAKVIEMPLLSEKELASAIIWEAEQHIPVPLNSINLDWRVLKKDNAHAALPKMQVLLIGAGQHVLKRYSDIFEMAGINISSLESEILAVYRAVVSEEQVPTSMIINIGSLGTSTAIVQNGTIVFLYTIPLGSAAINKSCYS
jgi:type IV pilus assembly protein PilM